MWTSLFWLSNFAQWSSELLNIWCMKLSGFLIPCLPWLPPHFSLTGRLPPSLGTFYTVLDICLHTSSFGPDVLLSSLLSAIPETKRGRPTLIVGNLSQKARACHGLPTFIPSYLLFLLPGFHDVTCSAVPHLPCCADGGLETISNSKSWLL